MVTVTQTQNDLEMWPRSKFLAATFLAMVIWPILGIAASFSMIDNISETVLLFGGVTTLLLLPIYMILPLNETVFGGTILAIWILVWIGCSLRYTSGSRTRRAQVTLLSVLSGISAGQAALGFLMILSKNI